MPDPSRAAVAAGTIAAPPRSNEASASGRSPASSTRRPSSSRSAPTTAAPSARRPSIARSNVANRLTECTPGRSTRVSSMPSSRSRGKIDVRTRSPGTTSAIQLLAAARACWPTPPGPRSATTRWSARRPSAPPGSGHEARRLARAAPRGGDRDEGRPGDARERGQGHRNEQRSDQEDDVDDECPDDGRLAGCPRPDGETEHADDSEYDDQPAQAGASGRGQLQARLECLDRGDPTRSSGWFDGGGHGHADTDRERRERILEARDRRADGHRADGADPAGNA